MTSPAPPWHRRGVDVTSALDELPETYRQVLELHRAGSSTADIAARLGIDSEAVVPMIRIALAKLNRLTDE